MQACIVGYHVLIRKRLQYAIYWPMRTVCQKMSMAEATAVPQPLYLISRPHLLTHNSSIVHSQYKLLTWHRHNYRVKSNTANQAFSNKTQNIIAHLVLVYQRYVWPCILVCAEHWYTNILTWISWLKNATANSCVSLIHVFLFISVLWRIIGSGML